ncbi:hypothetical protein BG015_004204 [Linnemannia schmuckeri]|uniref:Uncharacterized protein n=1 Tax=Linnemannia schmuckeri TaxID=64567 RepID=A0A9P5RG27_9FUNG|nr:hypothetical protein BG015_004204 [Linnemannia schmuckeri]
MTVGGQPDAKAQQDIPTHPAFTQGSLSLTHPPPASASASAFSSYQSSQDHQRQQHPPKDSQPKQGSTIWPVVQASAWFAYRASLWSMRTSYLAVRSVIAKPYSVVAALFETPYMMMKEICLAFLPVYSFFTIAAVIGILVGGMLPISPAPIPRDSTLSRGTTTLPSRTPGATTQTASEQGVRRRREILTDDDDDDEDDDDDNDWDRV